ncbi:hypothetical protein DLAC_01955 [Tieghemostelium lacteum]|uniref:Uncharacterized protein n=1 Tax=Tieghemostelium lacteum TaxID=361077 RepID=A0A152A558_TIELA|nr:hypothetical protein DLAC_01955 [Tieghemostelium lacteum]|eukprot:KYR01368.1 hypothetical protein DLAC_01955 [Tieghemostelium lacteum]
MENKIEYTKFLMRYQNDLDTHCLLSGYKINDFDIYVTPLNSRLTKDVNQEQTVKEFSIDNWWMLTRKLGESFYVITNKGIGDLGSVFDSKEAYLINFSWDYGSEKNNKESNHEKLGISTKSNRVCFGDGNRHYTQNKRPGGIFCVNNVILNTFLRKKSKLFYNEEPLILNNDVTEENFKEFLNQDNLDFKSRFLKSSRKFIFTPNNKVEKDDEKDTAKKKISKKRKRKNENAELDEKSLEALIDEYVSSKDYEPLKVEEKNEVLSPNRLYCFLRNGVDCNITPLNSKKATKDKIKMQCKSCKSYKTLDKNPFKLNPVDKNGVKSAIEKVITYLNREGYISLQEKKKKRRNK